MTMSIMNISCIVNYLFNHILILGILEQDNDVILYDVTICMLPT